MTEPDPNLGYASPPPASPGTTAGPGIALMVLGVLYILGNLLALVLHILGVGLGAAAGGNQAAENIMSGSIGIVMDIIGFFFGFLIAFGGLKMKNMQNYGLSMTAAILGMLPCSCCCIFGLPIGIWALVVLLKPEVKAAFR